MTTKGEQSLLSNLLTIEQLAVELEVKTSTIHRWKARRVAPPCIRIGIRDYYEKSTVRDWIANGGTQPRQQAGGRRK